MNPNKKPVSIGKSSAHTAKSQNNRPRAHRVAILQDSTIGKYTFRLRYKHSANGPNHVCIVHELGLSKKCAEDAIEINLYPESMNGYDLALLRFEPLVRSEFEQLRHFQQDDQMYMLKAAA
jgi:hypothetical protein